jgi:hypothetical protein
MLCSHKQKPSFPDYVMNTYQLQKLQIVLATITESQVSKSPLQNPATEQDYEPVPPISTRPRRLIFKGDKNHQHTFLRMGSKAVGPMS